ncbi:Uncharacterized protein dnm_010840 [Desulfonema magnum]|uniref:Uncharacterized protein n=1 Tax=Desulfonema magnum TaxID=45655 RepID=A0A975GL11_9BACT|nr:Uncharacterized protein dnm_010840 [Desulfonema magnum]
MKQAAAGQMARRVASVPLKQFQQIKKFSGCHRADTADGGETRLFPGEIAPFWKNPRVSLLSRAQSGNFPIC